MVTDFEPGAHDDVAVAPELEALNLVDKPDGPAGAAMLAAGFGILTLGLLTTLAVISDPIHDFLGEWDFDQGVGPLAGKTTIAVIVWLVSWLVLYLWWRNKDVNLKTMFYSGLTLGIIGAIGMFPPWFELFE
jgi:uncharacterized membrane protein YfcA